MLQDGASFLLPAFFYPVRINDDPFYIRELIDKSRADPIFYLNYYFFIPRLFERKNTSTYFFDCCSGFHDLPGPVGIHSCQLFSKTRQCFQFIQSIPSEPGARFDDAALAFYQ